MQLAFVTGPNLAIEVPRGTTVAAAPESMVTSTILLPFDEYTHGASFGLIASNPKISFTSSSLNVSSNMP